MRYLKALVPRVDLEITCSGQSEGNRNSRTRAPQLSSTLVLARPPALPYLRASLSRSPALPLTLPHLRLYPHRTSSVTAIPMLKLVLLALGLTQCHAAAATCSEAERKCSPGELSKYVLNTAATKKLGGINLSGGAFNEASCELWLVRNNPMTLERYDTATGTVLQTVTLYGGFNDPEGVCFLGSNTIVIAEERNHKLTKCTLPSSGTTSLSQSRCTVLSPAITGFDPNDSNKGT